MSEDYRELEAWCRSEYKPGEYHRRFEIADTLAALRRERDEALQTIKEEVALRVGAIDRMKKAERERDEAREEASAMAASVCLCVTGDEYGNAYCRVAKERDEAQAALARARAEGRIEGMEEAQKATRHDWRTHALISDLINAQRAALEGEKS